MNIRGILLLACIVLCSLTTVSQANVSLKTITFRDGSGINSFSDSRVTGTGSSLTIMFEMDKLSVGSVIEQQHLTVSDAQNNANNFILNNQIVTLMIEKDVVRVTDGLPVTVGLELGSLQSAALSGTVAAPADMSQISPLVGINGGLKYSTTAKPVIYSFFAHCGYRLIGIKNVAVPAGFTAGGADFKSLNGIHIEIGVGLGF